MLSAATASDNIYLCLMLCYSLWVLDVNLKNYEIAISDIWTLYTKHLKNKFTSRLFKDENVSL